MIINLSRIKSQFLRQYKYVPGGYTKAIIPHTTPALSNACWTKCTKSIMATIRLTMLTTPNNETKIPPTPLTMPLLARDYVYRLISPVPEVNFRYLTRYSVCKLQIHGILHTMSSKAAKMNSKKYARISRIRDIGARDGNTPIRDAT